MAGKNKPEDLIDELLRYLEQWHSWEDKQPPGGNYLSEETVIKGHVFSKPASLVTNTSYAQDVLFRRVEQQGTFEAIKNDNEYSWNPYHLNSYGWWGVKDWRLVFSYEALRAAGIQDDETIRAIKKDYINIQNLIASNPDFGTVWEHRKTKESNALNQKDKSGNPVGSSVPLSCWHTCQRFLYFSNPDLPWKLVEGYITDRPFDSMSGNQPGVTDWYYHAWLEFDGYIIDPVARNFVREFDVKSLDWSGQPYYQTQSIKPGQILEAVAPVYRLDCYRPIVKRSNTEEYRNFINTLVSHFQENPVATKWSDYTWVQTGIMAIAGHRLKNAGNNKELEYPRDMGLNRSFKIDDEEQWFEDPMFHFAFIGVTGNKELDIPIQQGEVIYNNHRPSKALESLMNMEKEMAWNTFQSKVMADAVSLLNSDRFLSQLESRDKKLFQKLTRPNTRKKLEQYRKNKLATGWIKRTSAKARDDALFKKIFEALENASNKPIP